MLPPDLANASYRLVDQIDAGARGTRYRYSVIFTNEDGGTPADRLMATWGRTTDIEYLYSVEIDRTGAILDDDIQGPEHEVLPFKGRREGAHPLFVGHPVRGFSARVRPFAGER